MCYYKKNRQLQVYTKYKFIIATNKSMCVVYAARNV